MNILRLSLELDQLSQERDELWKKIFQEVDPEGHHGDETKPIPHGWNCTLYADEGVIEAHITIDYPNLVKSVFEPGKYYLITCTCNVPQCTGINDPIGVTHENQVIRWHITDPRPERRFTFSKAQYSSAILSFLREVQNTVPPSDVDYEFRIGCDHFSQRDLDRCIRVLESGTLEGPSKERS